MAHFVLAALPVRIPMQLRVSCGRQVREEQAQVRPDCGATITADVLYRMTYTRAVVREILRFRPPAPMVPQVAPPHCCPPPAAASSTHHQDAHLANMHWHGICTLIPSTIEPFSGAVVNVQQLYWRKVGLDLCRLLETNWFCKKVHVFLSRHPDQNFRSTAATCLNDELWTMKCEDAACARRTPEVCRIEARPSVGETTYESVVKSQFKFAATKCPCSGLD